MYDEPEYARSRIEDTVVLLNGKAVYVTEVSGDMTCGVVSDLDDGGCVRVEVDDLQVLAPPLGFVNYLKGVVYLSRKPLRNDWRQGLRSNQIVDLTNRIGRGNISNKLIMKCVDGGFNTLAEAKALLLRGTKAVALSRDFSLNKASEVHYKWYGKVGALVKGEIKLSDKFSHLKAAVGVLK